ncbi:efflux RND transporter permease subunit [Runella slithyformis]|uniref:Acriflavin resistance protein n=1 Tax=Runella slithyformis (strain ATCC 29530 / DSM 19594 / LMG 11500 / NCIMB 11436 / LSU 4) TaxID=761193 RepID=A0A7U3ZRV3_RUNSL|nr:efflux RND transporter permease subunit [Runella slithyformis]AEI52206.1 acriflavin resistance protein [Runella slithyformis DSM 19594]
MTLTELAIKRPSLLIVLFLVLALGGIMSYNRLGYEILPRFTPQLLTITTVYPGAAPNEIESQVTKKIEDQLSNQNGIVSINSSSFEGLSLVSLELSNDASLKAVKQDVIAKINSLQSLLPNDAQTPTVSELSFNDLPVLRISATADLTATQFFSELKNRIIPQLSQLDGVGSVELLGGEEREIRVNINQDKISAYGISILQVNQAINNANLDFPTGKIEAGKTQTVIRLTGKFNKIEQLKDLIVATSRMGGTIKLQDIAEVIDSKKDIRNINRLNGKEAVGVQVRKRTDANSVAVSKAVRDKIAELENKYSNINLKFVVAIDTSSFSLEAAEAVQHDLLIAILLVALVMLIFLHSIRNSFIVMVAVPCSLVTAFIIMYLAGYTFNLMTLLAMSLVIGILVDDSIVVLENIYRHLEMGKDARTAAIDGRNEIGFTALSITLVDVVVFVPFLLLTNTTGKLLAPFAAVVVVSTLMSLFVSFTVTPWLASRFAKAEDVKTKKGVWGRFVRSLEIGIEHLSHFYAAALSRCLQHKTITILFIVAMIMGAGQLVRFGFIGDEFVKQGDQREFIIKLEYDKSITFQQNNLTTKQVEDFLREKPYVKSVFANVGGSSDLINLGNSNNQSEINVKIYPNEIVEKATDQAATECQMALQRQFPQIKITSAKPSFLGGNEDDPIEIIFSGENPDSVLAVVKSVEKTVRKIPGAIDTKVSIKEGFPEVNVSLDRDKMAKLGLDINLVGATMQSALAGNDKAKFRDGFDEYDIKVQLDKFDRRNEADVAALSFINNKGQTIRLDQFASLSYGISASKLERKNRRSSVTFKSQVLGTPSGNVADAIQAEMDKMNLPKNIEYSWAGEIKRSKDSTDTLLAVLGIAIILIYLIMVALYDSFIYPFVVLFSIPVALIGALLALALAKSSFSLFTGLGIIMMLGLVAKNGILIVDFTNQLKEKGLNTIDALMESGKTRLRPILMTTLALVFGMIPIAIAKGAGAEWKNGLGWVLIGGLTSSMLLTLIIVPVVYLTVDNIKAWFGKLGANKKKIERMSVAK